MVYYFSGASHQPLKLEYNVDQLFSYFHEQKRVIETIQYKKDNPEKDFKIMLDSGAFTHYQQAKKKGIILTDADMYEYTDGYIEFLNTYGKELEVFVGVDSVPNPENVDPTFAQKTWENYLYMYERLNPDIRHKLMPVFHFGEDFKWLKNMLEHVHEDGTHLDYIGLAISLEGTAKIRISWANECRRMIEASSNPDVKTHAFGVGVKSVLKSINVTSTDATSWVKRAAYGMVSIDDKSIYVSDVQRENLERGAHYTERSTAFQQSVEDIIRERGFTPEQLETDNVARAKFNIIDTLEWVSKLEQEKKTINHKTDLWS